MLLMINRDYTRVLGSGMPNHYAGDLLHTIAISGLSRVRTELLQLAVVAALPLHAVELHLTGQPRATMPTSRLYLDGIRSNLPEVSV